MTPKTAVNKLGGIGGLTALSGIPRSTIHSWATGARGVLGPARLCLSLMLVLQRAGTLEETLERAKKINIEDSIKT